MATPRPPDRRDQLTAAAAELFGTRGYREVGVNDIAAVAGVTGPAVYRHFPDKQAILAHVLLCAVDEMRRATAAALSTVAGPSERQVEALLGAQAAAAVERRDVAAVWRLQERHLAGPQRREFARRSAAVLDTWARALRGIRPQLGQADADLLCRAWLSVFGSVSTHHTSVARPRFVDLLAAIAGRVAHTHLPPPASDAGIGQAHISATPSRREQLLAAATELFHRYGFREVTMEDIGGAVGITGPSVYRHFPGKQAILCAIARRAADRLAIDAEQALRTSTSERQALHRLVTSYVRALTASRELTVAFSIDTANLAEADRSELVSLQRDYVGCWADLLHSAHPDLNLREAKITVHAALAIANDLARTRRFGTRPHLPTDLVALMSTALDIG